MGMKYVAISKESGKKVVFGSKDAMNAALKAGTHTIPGKAKGKGGPATGKSVFGTHAQRSVYDGDTGKIVTFKTKAERDAALKRDKYRYGKISTAKDAPKDVSSVITNGNKEAEFYDAISNWTQWSDMDSAKKLNRLRKYFNKGKEIMPGVFKPNVKPGKPVYRGLQDISRKTKSWIKTTDWKDWKPVTDKALKNFASSGGLVGEQWYIYTGKNRKSFTYRPHRPAQSWTTDPETAFDFTGDALLVQPIDNSFYFSPKYMNRLGFAEDEVLRLGGPTRKPQILVSAQLIRELKHKEIR